MRTTVRPHASLRAIFFACFAFLLAGLTVSADDATRQDRSVSKWIDAIQKQADRWYKQETEAFAAIRLTAGWTMPNLSGLAHQIREKEEELPVLKQWLERDGYPLLNRLLKGPSI